jgi:hypothetical protein
MDKDLTDFFSDSEIKYNKPPMASLFIYSLLRLIDNFVDTSNTGRILKINN